MLHSSISIRCVNGWRTPWTCKDHSEASLVTNDYSDDVFTVRFSVETIVEVCYHTCVCVIRSRTDREVAMSVGPADMYRWTILAGVRFGVYISRLSNLRRL
jgi:hypothetical protein